MAMELAAAERLQVAKWVASLGFVRRRMARTKLLRGPRAELVSENLFVAMELLMELVGEAPVAPPFVRQGGLQLLQGLANKQQQQQGQQHIGKGVVTASEATQMEASFGSGEERFQKAVAKQVMMEKEEKKKKESVDEQSMTEEDSVAQNVTQEVNAIEGEVAAVDSADGFRPDPEVVQACHVWCGPHWQAALRGQDHQQESVRCFGGMSIFGAPPGD